MLVDTPKPDKSRYALTSDGKIDYEVYKGLTASVEETGLIVDVRIVDTRRRYGHLDFLVVPVSGSGERWTEFKNVTLHEDPVAKASGLPTHVVAPAVTVATSPYGTTHWSEQKL